MEVGYGGPVWHASVSPYDGLSFSLARAIAHRSLEAVGDASLGEWEEKGRAAFHVRRRLSLDEQKQYGLVMRDIRGTNEAMQRAIAVVRLVPQARQMAAQEVFP